MEVRPNTTPGVISYLGVTFHQNGVIHGKCAQIRGISHRFIPFSTKVVAYSNYLIDKDIMNTIDPTITSDVVNHF